MKKKLLAAVLCIAMTVSAMAVLTSCGNNDEPTEQTAEKVTLKVGMLGKDIKTACIILASKLGGKPHAMEKVLG